MAALWIVPQIPGIPTPAFDNANAYTVDYVVVSPVCIIVCVPICMYVCNYETYVYVSDILKVLQTNLHTNMTFCIVGQIAHLYTYSNLIPNFVYF